MDAINVIVKLFTRFQSFVADSASHNKINLWSHHQQKMYFWLEQFDCGDPRLSERLCPA